MELYLIRHGIAAERGTYERDEERPLTEVGRQKTQKVARRLAEIGIGDARLLSSPLVRAVQTAELLQSAGLSATLEIFAPLAPGGEILAFETWCQQQRESGNRSDRLILVGHQPDLGNWAEMLVWGTATEKIVVKKAGIIGAIAPDTGKAIGRCELFLLTSPKWFI